MCVSDLGGNHVDAEADSPNISGLSVHHNQLWSHDTDSVSIPTTAAAATLGSAASSGPHVAATSQAGRRPLLAPLPIVKGGTSPTTSTLSRPSGNLPTSTAGTHGDVKCPHSNLTREAVNPFYLCFQLSSTCCISKT